MTDADAPIRRGSGSHPSHTPEQHPGSGRSSERNSAAFHELESLLDGERELVQELIRALREIRYGSIVLTVHDGQVVEINKSIRIRKSRTGKKE
jgi:hypothetical protein